MIKKIDVFKKTKEKLHIKAISNINFNRKLGELFNESTQFKLHS